MAAGDRAESTGMTEFQDSGESWRQLFGIDGTAGDAQDIPHPFVPASPGGACTVCGLPSSHRKHTENWTTGLYGRGNPGEAAW
jgi:hypothetical protein